MLRSTEAMLSYSRCVSPPHCSNLPTPRASVKLCSLHRALPERLSTNPATSDQTFDRFTALLAINLSLAIEAKQKRARESQRLREYQEEHRRQTASPQTLELGLLVLLLSYAFSMVYIAR